VPDVVDVNSAKRSPWIGFLFSSKGKFKVSFLLSFFVLSLLKILSISVLNSISSKIVRNLFSSGSCLFKESISSSMGTSVFMVAKNLEKTISSLLASILVLTAPFNFSVFSKRFSILPNSEISFWAVFSPTPGQPGILSEASPIKPNMSIT